MRKSGALIEPPSLLLFISSGGAIMRRKEFEVIEQADIDSLLATVEFGYLAAIRPDGWPTVVPLNFVYFDNRIYYHGAREGEKMESIKQDNRVSFIIVDDYSI